MNTPLQYTAWLVTVLLLVLPQTVLGQDVGRDLYGDHGRSDHFTSGTHPFDDHSFEELANENDIAMPAYEACREGPSHSQCHRYDVESIQYAMIDKFWEREVRRSEIIDHERVAHEYPEIGWLSGLWCQQGNDEPMIRFEILGDREVRISTKGDFWKETEPIMVNGSRDYRAEPQKVMDIFQALRAGGRRAGPFYYDFWDADLDGTYSSVTLKRIERREEYQFVEVYEDRSSSRFFKDDADEAYMYSRMAERATMEEFFWTSIMYTKCGL